MYIRLGHNILCNTIPTYDKVTTSIANFLDRKVTSKIPKSLLYIVDKVAFVFEIYLRDLAVLGAALYGGIYLGVEAAHLSVMLLTAGMWLAWDMVRSGHYYPYDYLENANEECLQGKMKHLVIDTSAGSDLDKMKTYFQASECNNVLLVGGAGTGKTSMVDSLAKWIESDSCPPELKGRQVLKLDMVLLKSDTREMGSFEQRFNYVLGVVRMKPEKYVLFIDEIHQLFIDDRSRELSIALLKYLQLGLRCIGATTNYEYNKYIKKGGGLSRRFNKIDMPKVSDDKCKSIIKQKFSAYSFDDRTLSHIITKAREVYPDYDFPDSALKLVRNTEAYMKTSKKGQRMHFSPDIINETIRMLNIKPDAASKEISESEYRKQSLSLLSRIAMAFDRGGAPALSTS